MPVNSNTLIHSIDRWPPAYTIKKHPHARRVKIKISADRDLELVVPPSFRLADLPDILLRHRRWIEKKLGQLAVAPASVDNLPTEVKFHAIAQTWKIHAVPTLAKIKLMVRPQHELVLFGNMADKQNCKKLLIGWIKSQAKIYLVNRLQEISQITGLSYQKITIRDQRTRWGSCTKNKSISLNYKLIFLPARLADHILIHELCHTVHLNHSKKFWQLVKKFDPDCEQHRREMRDVKEYNSI